MTEVTLTGEAALGLAASAEHRRLAAALPQTVKLGRVAPKSRPQTLRLEAFVDLVRTTPRPAVDWYTKAAESIARMYLNDRYGDCVFAGKAHLLGVWSANDPDSAGGRTVLATDKEISDQYFAYTGGRDTGANISEVLDYMAGKGFLAGGQRYRLAGYVAADWRSKELTQVGIDLFGGGCIGVNLPAAWTSEAVWDVTNTRIVGGHDVSPCGYGANVLGTTADGVVISSWGRLYLITWRAWTSAAWLEELYFCVPEFLWTGLDGMAPSGVNLVKLKDAMAMVGGGQIPPLPDPTPSPPPSPPVPPVPPTPAPSVVSIPALNVRLFGFSLGHTDPVTVPIGPQAVGDLADVDWRLVARDVAKLIGHAAAEPIDWSALVNDAAAIVHDLHLFAAKSRGLGPVVPWFQIAFDAYALIRAALAKDIPGVIAALVKLAGDFGLSLAPHEFAAHLSACGVSC